MHCVKKITDDLYWVGANDRRLAMFEGVYSVPDGVSYNSYLLKDEKTVLFDTVDKAVGRRFFENLAAVLNGAPLDYVVVQHMEPDHSAALVELLCAYPGVKIVCNAKTLAFINQFNNMDIGPRAVVVNDGDTLASGRHTLTFVMAPMVHWPEVMVTYDAADKILFSADAFGCFGALNGALFADEVDFAKDYADEARRYYANIVGKYGTQVSALLNKASALAIETICPLHGFVWRKNLREIMSKYILWSGYAPEEQGVMIAYASVYGNTENAAEILACRLREAGIVTRMYDVSVAHASDIVAAAFKWSHLVFASTTYNAGIFVAMEALLNDLVSHNIQNRTVALIENGSWAATSGGLMREKLSKCKNMTVLDETVSIKSGLKPAQSGELSALADAIARTFPERAKQNTATGATGATGAAGATGAEIKPAVDKSAMFKLSYGLFVLTAKEGEKDNGCIINTAAQLTDEPLRISVTVNNANHTRGMIARTGEFAVSVLTESAPFNIFERFGFKSGADTDKFLGLADAGRTAGGLRCLNKNANAVIAAKVSETVDCGTHTLFIADVTEAFALSNEPSVTYAYYFENIKPKPRPPKEIKSGYVCRICGYVHEGDVLPENFICPLCKHGAADFEPL